MNEITNLLEKATGKSIDSINHHNSNRYRMLVKHESEKYAYYFSAPIYNKVNRHLTEMCFRQGDEYIESIGSDNYIKINNDGICFSNGNGIMYINILLPAVIFQKDHLKCGNLIIKRTLNGLLLEINNLKHNPFNFTITTENEYDNIRQNGKFIALMQERFHPFATISGMFSTNDRDFHPINLICENLNNHTFTVHVESVNKACSGKLVLEINLHEPKSIQDTTVESKAVSKNNVFGGIAFIGNSEALGEQWLYLRPDYSILHDLAGCYIEDINLYVPQYNLAHNQLIAYSVNQHFCSFGTSWQNKVRAFDRVSTATFENGYNVFNLNKSFLTKNSHILISTHGIIIKPASLNQPVSVVSTSDNYYNPVFLQIKYR